MSPLDEFTAALQRYRPYLEEADYARLVEESDQIASSAVRLNLLKSEIIPMERLSYLSERYSWITKTLPYSADSVQLKFASLAWKNF